MTGPADSDAWSLTEKEKQTLRLIVRGHDAKSIARDLDLSVHTINERLRDARRKMAVSSSREAARLLLVAESGAGRATPENVGDMEIGEAARRDVPEGDGAPVDGAKRTPVAFAIIGVCIMTVLVALLALTALPQGTSSPAPVAAAVQDAPDPAVVDAARAWLMLLDDNRWDESYRATGSAFRSLNTLEVWSRVSDRVRRPLGKVISRTFVSQENLPAPPQGYEVVKFRSSFANKADAIETVTLDREGGVWRVVGVTVG